jgi:hypothetical protein
MNGTLRIASILIAGFCGALALLLAKGVPTVLAVVIPATASVLVVRATGGVPQSGPAALDMTRVERVVNWIVAGFVLAFVAYLILG